MTTFGQVCAHDQLARQCPLCERDKTIAELRAALAKLVEAARLYADQHTICHNTAACTVDRLSAAMNEAKELLPCE